MDIRISAPLWSVFSKTLVAFGLMLGFAGCASVQSLDRTYVKAQSRTLGVDTGKAYALVFNNEESQKYLESNRDALISLRLALEEKGYVESEIAENANLFVVLNCGFLGEKIGYKPKALSPRELNPDSIRYKNVAGMVGAGRYKGLLDDDPFSSERESLPTFDDGGAPLRERAIDELIDKRNQRLGPNSEAAILYVSYLTVGAWRPIKAEGRLEVELLWEVTVMNDQFDEKLEKRMDRLVHVSAAYIEANTGDWNEIVVK